MDTDHTDQQTIAALRAELLDPTLQAKLDTEPIDFDLVTERAIRGGDRVRRVRAAAGVVSVVAVLAAATLIGSQLPLGDRDVQPAGTPSAVVTAPAPITPTPSQTPRTDNSMPVESSFPITIDPPAGWECLDLVDEKASCTSSNGDDVELIVRPGSTYAEWRDGEPDRNADWVSPLQSGGRWAYSFETDYFVTLVGRDAAGNRAPAASSEIRSAITFG